MFVLAGVFTASAQTTIVMTGSTAFRSQTHAGILAAMDAAPAPQFKFTGGTLGSANAAVFVGNCLGNPVIIKCSWSGSSGGIQTTSATAPALTVGTLDTTGVAVSPGTSGATDPRNPKINPLRPDIAMGDSTQSSTPFRGVVATNPSPTPPGVTGNTYVTLLDATINSTSANPNAVHGAPSAVGIVPFRWVVSKSGPAGLNMTNQFAQALYNTVGAAPLALLTGLAADEGTTVYATGRDPDSGTRVIVLAEARVATPVVQNTITAAAGAMTNVVLSSALNNPPGLNGYAIAAGDNGESSGGTLATRLGNTGPVGAAAPLGRWILRGLHGSPGRLHARRPRWQDDDLQWCRLQ